MLTWAAPSSDGGTPITGYQLKLISGPSQTSVDISDAFSCTAGSCAYTLTALVNGTRYTLKKADAANAAGSSPVVSTVTTPHS